MDKLSAFKSRIVPQQRFGDLRVGWTVKINQKLREGEKAKSQTFEGIIIARKHGNEPGATITVRKISGGIGVEKILPLQLPSIEKIEVTKKPKIRRAKLYYLRTKSSKEIRKKTKHEVTSSNQEKQLEPVKTEV
ncbi:MAG TPA: 50S ribosomal protein L19 [Candidatus Paceibacterota bacterium]|nr:50S ribosomal protein L19 [Candidatus Paceibacterota bacterium]